MRIQQSVFYQCHITRTSYHARTYWLQYRINLVPRVPVDFQQKTYLSLNDWIDPKIVIGFGDFTRYAKWWFLCVNDELVLQK